MILLAAALIAGGLYLYANNAGSSLSAIPGGKERPAFDGSQPPTDDKPGRPVRGGEHGALGQGEGRAGGEDGFSLAGWSGVLMQAGKVGLITLVVVALQAVIQWIRRRQHPAGERVAPV
jgi:hypothetical protein